MVEEEGAVMGGLLVGLNVIDANLCIKGEDLDSQVSAGRFRGPTLPSSHASFLSMRNSRHRYTVISFSFPFRWESLTSPFI